MPQLKPDGLHELEVALEDLLTIPVAANAENSLIGRGLPHLGHFSFSLSSPSF